MRRRKSPYCAVSPMTSESSGMFSSSQWKSGTRPFRSSGRSAVPHENSTTRSRMRCRVSNNSSSEGPAPTITAVSGRRRRGLRFEQMERAGGEIRHRVLHHAQLVLEETAIDEGELDRLVEALPRLGEGPERVMGEDPAAVGKGDAMLCHGARHGRGHGTRVDLGDDVDGAAALLEERARDPANRRTRTNVRRTPLWARRG